MGGSPTIFALSFHLKLMRKRERREKIQAEVLPKCFRDVSVCDSVEVLHHSSPFFVRSSSFFDLQLVSSRIQSFQFILCTLNGPLLFYMLSFLLRLLSVFFVNRRQASPLTRRDQRGHLRIFVEDSTSIDRDYCSPFLLPSSDNRVQWRIKVVMVTHSLLSRDNQV